MKEISPDELAQLSEAPGEWALFDIREAGEADRGHIFGATFLPRRLIEARIGDLVQAPRTTIVVYDEGGGGARAMRAAETLAGLGYTDVRVLRGGTAAWAASGRKLSTGSNVPSKLFGEQIYEHEHVPQLPIATFKQWQDAGREVVVCDIRTPEEYEAARIPGAWGAFGVDLALVAGDLKARGVPVVVHCAGRTRSIISCQALRLLGVKEVYALENGTMGWQVAGHALEKGPPRGVMQPTAESAAQGEEVAGRLAHDAGAEEVDVQTLRHWLEEREAGKANLYVFDVRQVPDYERGHVPGSIALPGGLAVQRTDEFAPLRNARTVLIDENSARASLTAYWFRKQGRSQVYVLKGGLNAWRAAGLPVEAGRKRKTPLGWEAARKGVNYISPTDLAKMQDARILHVDSSRDFKKARVPGAEWTAYGSLEERVSADQRPLVLTCQNGVLSTFAAANLARMGMQGVRVLEGGTQAWVKAGLPADAGWPEGAAAAEDIVVPPYNSNLESMKQYLAWEQKLTAERRAEKPA